MDSNWSQYNQYGRLPSSSIPGYSGYPGMSAPAPTGYGMPAGYAPPPNIPPHVDSMMPGIGGSYPSGTGYPHPSRATHGSMYSGDPMTDRLPMAAPGYAAQYSSLPTYDPLSAPADPYTSTLGPTHRISKATSYGQPPDIGLPQTYEPPSYAGGYNSSVPKATAVPPIETLRRPSTEKIQSLPSVNKLLDFNSGGADKPPSDGISIPPQYTDNPAGATSNRPAYNQGMKNSLSDILNENVVGNQASDSPTHLSKKIFEDIIKLKKQQTPMYTGMPEGGVQSGIHSGPLPVGYGDSMTPHSQHQQTPGYGSYGKSPMDGTNMYQPMGMTAQGTIPKGNPDFLNFDVNFDGGNKGKMPHGDPYGGGPMPYPPMENHMDPYRTAPPHMMSHSPYDRKQPVQAPADSTTKPKKRRKKKDKVTDTLAAMKSNMNMPMYDHMPAGQQDAMGVNPMPTNDMMAKPFDKSYSQQGANRYGQRPMPPYQPQKHNQNFNHPRPPLSQRELDNYSSQQNHPNAPSEFTNDMYGMQMKHPNSLPPRDATYSGLPPNQAQSYDAMSKMTGTATHEQNPQQELQQMYDSLQSTPTLPQKSMSTQSHPAGHSEAQLQNNQTFYKDAHQPSNPPPPANLTNTSQQLGSHIQSPQHVSSTQQSPQQSGVPQSPLHSFGSAVPPSPQYGSNFTQSPQHYMGGHSNHAPASAQQHLPSNIPQNSHQSLGSTCSPQLTPGSTSSPQQPPVGTTSFPNQSNTFPQSPMPPFGSNVSLNSVEPQSTDSPTNNVYCMSSPQQPTSVTQSPQQQMGVPPSPQQQQIGVPQSQHQQKMGVPPSPQQQMGVPPSPQQQMGVPPSPQQQMGVPPSPQQQLGVPPSPQQQMGVPPSPQQQQMGVPPSPQQQMGVFPSSQQQMGVPPSAQQQVGVPPSPQQQMGVPPSPQQQQMGVSLSPQNQQQMGVFPSSQQQMGVPPSPQQQMGVSPSSQQQMGVPLSPQQQQMGVPPSPQQQMGVSPSSQQQQMGASPNPQQPMGITSNSQQPQFDMLQQMYGESSSMMANTQQPFGSPPVNSTMPQFPSDRPRDDSAYMFDDQNELPPLGPALPGPADSRSYQGNMVQNAPHMGHPSGVGSVGDFQGHQSPGAGAPPTKKKRTKKNKSTLSNEIMMQQMANIAQYEGRPNMSVDEMKMMQSPNMFGDMNNPQNKIMGKPVKPKKPRAPRKPKKDKTLTKAQMKSLENDGAQSFGMMQHEGPTFGSPYGAEQGFGMPKDRLQQDNCFDGSSIPQTLDTAFVGTQLDSELTANKPFDTALAGTEPIKASKPFDTALAGTEPINTVLPGEMPFDSSKSGLAIKRNPTIGLPSDAIPSEATVIGSSTEKKPLVDAPTPCTVSDPSVQSTVEEAEDHKNPDSFHKSFMSFLQKKPDTPPTDTSPSEGHSLNTPPSDVEKIDSNAITESDAKLISNMDHVQTKDALTAHTASKSDVSVKPTKETGILSQILSPTKLSNKPPPKPRQGAKTKEQMCLKIQQIKQKKRALEMAKKLQQLEAAEEAKKKQSREVNKKTSALMDDSSDEDDIKKQAASVVNQLIAKSVLPVEMPQLSSESKIDPSKDSLQGVKPLSKVKAKALQKPKSALPQAKTPLMSEPKVESPVTPPEETISADLAESKSNVRSADSKPILDNAESELKPVSKSTTPLSVHTEPICILSSPEHTDSTPKSSHLKSTFTAKHTIPKVCVVPTSQRPPLLSYKRKKEKREKREKKEKKPKKAKKVRKDQQWMGDVYGLQGESLLQDGDIPKEEIPTRHMGNRRAKEVVEAKKHKMAERKVRKRCRRFYSEVAWDSSSEDEDDFFISTESEESSSDEDPAWMPQHGQPNTMKVLAGVAEEENEPTNEKQGKRRRKSSTGSSVSPSSAAKKGKATTVKPKALKRSPKSTSSKVVKTEWQINSYIVSKEEFNDVENQKQEMFTIWRIDSESTMQKYEPVRKDGELKHKAQPTYIRYTDADKHLYRVISVCESRIEQGVDFVKVIDADLPASYLIDVNTDAILLSDDEALRLHSEPRTSQASSPNSTKSTSNNPGESKQSTSEKSPYRYVSSITSSMNVYIQMLVSHVLQPGILAAMMESKDNYYSVPLRKIDDLIKDYVEKLQPSVKKWRKEFQSSVEMCPDLIVMNSDQSSNQICSCCATCLDKDNTDFYKTLRLSGTPYKYDSLTPIESSTLSSEHVVCGASSFLVETYHHLYHYKQNIATLCANKIAEVKKKDSAIEMRALLDNCLTDKPWIDSILMKLDDIFSDATMLLSMSDVLND